MLYRLLVCSLFFLALASPTLAQEKILSYKSRITIAKDSTLLIKETIEVVALGKHIKRGIYRDFPTRYKDRLGRNIVVDFKVLSVKRNNRSEPYHTKNQRNGVRVYVGRKSRRIPSGTHTYELEYKTNRQLGYFENHDELYFNAIGFGWIFPIEKASVEVLLPDKIDPSTLMISGYTGRFGSRRTDFTYQSLEYGVIHFEMTKPLAPKEGFTIVVAWPKGYVSPPSLLKQAFYFFRDNFVIASGLCFASLLLGFYFFSWNKYGRDPKPGTVFPQFHSPDELSSAEVEYIQSMGYSNRCLSAAISEIAIKGGLTISERDGVFTIYKKDSEAVGLLEHEKRLIDTFFYGTSSFSFKSENYKKVQEAKKILLDYLESKHLKKTFFQNRKFVIIGVIAIVCYLILILPLSSVISPNSGHGIYVFVILVCLSVATAIFSFLIKVPTRFGRKIMDNISGYKMYLETAEAQTLNQMSGAEEITPKVYEKHLPYAIALGVEDIWRKKFEKALEQRGESVSSYNPDYFSSSHRNSTFSSNSFSSSLTSAISSSSTPPGSSSGGGGGGFSGGGGGGGGGGGW